MPVIVKPVLEDVDTNTTPLTKKPKRAKKVELKDATINTYVSKLRAFHKRMTGLPLSDDIINAIKGNPYDKKAVQEEFKYLYTDIKKIKETELKSIPNLVKVFTKITGFVKLIKILTPDKRALEVAYETRRNESVIPADKLISFDKQTLLKNAIEKLKTDQDKLLYLIMTLIPTRRLDDYRTMVIGKTADGNYYENGVMYIKDTATKNKQNIAIKIPNEIIDLIPTEGYFLTKQYTQSSLSKRFVIVMEAVYGYKITANELRRIFLTTINEASVSFKERRDVADAVGTSVMETLKYALKVA
jgi:hypothetical protein